MVQEKINRLKNAGWEVKQDVKYGNRRRNFRCTPIEKDGIRFPIIVGTDSEYASSTLNDALRVETGQQKENSFHPTKGMRLIILSPVEGFNLPYQHPEDALEVRNILNA